jgi:hypothetical protein
VDEAGGIIEGNGVHFPVKIREENASGCLF